MASPTVGIQRVSEPSDSTNRVPVILDQDMRPVMVHAGTQTATGNGNSGGGASLGKTRSQSQSSGMSGIIAHPYQSYNGGITAAVAPPVAPPQPLQPPPPTAAAAAAPTGGAITNRELRELSRRSHHHPQSQSHHQHGSHNTHNHTHTHSHTHSSHHPSRAQTSSSSSPSSHSHAHMNPRRAAKIRHRSSTSTSTSTSAFAATATAAASSPSTVNASTNTIPTTNHVNHANQVNHPNPTNHSNHVLPSDPGAATAAIAAAAAGITSSGVVNNSGRHTPGTITPFDMDPPVLSFWGTDPVPLPSRFARIKRKIVAGHEAELSASWARLITALRDEVDHIEGLGPHLMPSIQFSDIEDPSQSTRFSRDLKRYGVGVVRGVVPIADAGSYVRETVSYLQSKDNVKPPPVQDPTCFDFFWTPAQVRTRAHPHVLKAQRFMMSLWETTADDKVATKYPITYADRIRIHGLPGQGMIGATKPPHNTNEPTKSADDWLNAIQSSTIIAQVDNGSLERWEPDGYQRGGTYDRVFNGDWETHDPWECAGRVSTTTDLYNGYGACSIFRMFQGLLALSTIEPGMVRLLPSPKLATAYFLLRPFFSPKTPPPEVREGDEWDRFLSPDNWKLDEDQSTVIHGAVPGHAQRVTELWHPHLCLRRSLVTLPTLQAGDYIFWHPDLAYHITSDGTGLRRDHEDIAPDDVRMLVYLPSAPLTQTNALYLARQRKQFLRGHPGPDFDSSGSGLGTEAAQAGRLGKEDIAQLGGPSALQSMGLAPYEMTTTPPTADPVATPVNIKADVDMDDAKDAEETKSVKSTSSSSHGEAEVVRLGNIILFPDQCNMGFPSKSVGGANAAVASSAVTPAAPATPLTSSQVKQEA